MIAIHSGAKTKWICPLNDGGPFTRSGEEGKPLLALHPRCKRDYYRGVTFLVEATRPADLIVVDQILRWTAAGVLEAERNFRRVAGLRALAKLDIALRAHDAATNRGVDNRKQAA